MEMTKMIGKCGAGMASAWNGMVRTAGNTKQDGKISEAEKSIDRLTAEIGRLTVLRLDNGMKSGEEIRERYDAIQRARADIEAARADKNILKVTCPHCGRKVTAGMQFCGSCGKLLAEQQVSTR